jgi:hypothetical protein
LQGRKLGRAAAAGAGTRDEAISVGASLVVAAVAGCTNVMLTLPIWVVITQMQALQKAGGEAARNAHMLNVARQMYADGGVLAFWKVGGTAGRALWVHDVRTPPCSMQGCAHNLHASVTLLSGRVSPALISLWTPRD